MPVKKALPDSSDMQSFSRQSALAKIITPTHLMLSDLDRQDMMVPRAPTYCTDPVRLHVWSGSRASPSAIDVGLSISAMAPLANTRVAVQYVAKDHERTNAPQDFIPVANSWRRPIPLR
jgi:hypothetical protein